MDNQTSAVIEDISQTNSETETITTLDEYPPHPIIQMDQMVKDRLRQFLSARTRGRQ